MDTITMHDMVYISYNGGDWVLVEVVKITDEGFAGIDISRGFGSWVMYEVWTSSPMWEVKPA